MSLIWFSGDKVGVLIEIQADHLIARWRDIYGRVKKAPGGCQLIKLAPSAEIAGGDQQAIVLLGAKVGREVLKVAQRRGVMAEQTVIERDIAEFSTLKSSQLSLEPAQRSR